MGLAMVAGFFVDPIFAVNVIAFGNKVRIYVDHAVLRVHIVGHGKGLGHIAGTVLGDRLDEISTTLGSIGSVGYNVPALEDPVGLFNTWEFYQIIGVYLILDLA